MENLILCVLTTKPKGFPGGSVVKNRPANAGDPGDAGLIPGLERSPGEGTGNLLQYSCLGNPMDRGAWWDKAHRVAKSLTQLSDQACMHAPPNQRKLKQKPKEHKETTGGDTHVNCLYCGDGFLKSA